MLSFVTLRLEKFALSGISVHIFKGGKKLWLTNFQNCLTLMML
ncbi:hypothetical protein C2W63_01780 [Bacillus velezensis]|nr:hypothetical protein C2W63_01780 [Bacillus velezensis]